MQWGRVGWRVAAQSTSAQRLSDMYCIAHTDGLKGVCVVTNAGYARADERSVLRGRHHAHPARVATRQFLRWLLDQYRRWHDWLMVPRSAPCPARRLPLACGALFRL